MLRAGARQCDVADQLGVSREAVRRWWRGYERDGITALKARPRGGPKRKVSETALKKGLPRALLKGAEANGFTNDIWTLDRVATVIERDFGVRYSIGHTWRILHELLGWSCQKPQRKALERDEEAVRTFLMREWPDLKKTLSRDAQP
jgi:transposase